MYIPGTTYLHILMHCTLYLIAHLTPYFISYLSLISFSPYLYIYIYSLVFCFIVFIAFMLLCFIYFLHFPLSGPVLINISLPIIPCMIMYVTNNKEPWTLSWDDLHHGLSRIVSLLFFEATSINPSCLCPWKIHLNDAGMFAICKCVCDLCCKTS